MKKLKTFVTMLSAAAAMFFLPGIFTLNVSAEEPATFYISYDPDNFGWYVLVEADLADEDNAEQKVMQVFYNYAKDGDAVVVSCAYDGAPQLDLGTVRLSNVTILSNSSFIMIKAGHIHDFYALANSTSSISAPVTNAYVYDPAVVNFNNDVENILLNVDAAASTSSMGCTGTVGSVKVLFTYNNTSYSLYNFKKDTFFFKDGSLETSAGNFSGEPAAATPSPTPSATSQPAISYDRIPKLKEVFDEHYYADKYGDLKAAFGYDREALWKHYTTYGIKEDRTMNNLLDVAKYRKTYSDLNAAFGDNLDAYLEHYLIYGAAEGRDSGTGFNALDYASKYTDLQSTYGNNVLALWKHYNTVGIREGR